MPDEPIWAAVSGGAAAPAVAAPPIINRGLPVTDSTSSAGQYAPANAVSSDHGATWRSITSPNGGTPVWIAQDLRSIPSAAKSSVWLTMRNPTRPVYQPSATLGSQAGSTFNTLPRNFLIQGHASSGALPAAGDAGWLTLAAVIDNRRADLILTGLNLSVVNWLRIYVTASSGVTASTDDVSFRFELRDVRGGATRVVGLFGDSISQEGFALRNLDNTAWPIGGIEDQLELAAAEYPPTWVDVGSLGGQNASGALSTIADYLNNASAPAPNCTHILVCLGTNDVNSTSAAFSGIGDAFVVAWINNMQSILNYITQTLGKIAVLPHISLRTDAAYSAGNSAIINQAIDQLVASNPGVVIAGPDVYALINNHANVLRDGIHPGWDITQAAQLVAGMVGYQHLQRLWVDHLLTLLYDTGRAQAPDRIDVSPLANPTAKTAASWATYAASAYNRYVQYVQDAGTLNDFLEFEVNLKAGWYFLDTYVVGGPALGAMTAALTGPAGSVSLGTVDTYQAAAADLVSTLGPVKAPITGRYFLRYTATAKNAASTGTTLQLRHAQLRRA